MIQIAKLDDLAAIVAIYNEAVQLRYATADTEPVSVESRQRWFAEHDPKTYPIYTYTKGGEILGWCSISPYRPGRKALRFTAEISYYVTKKAQRQGVASALITHAFVSCEQLRIKNLFAIVLECNPVSCALLEKMSFERWGFLPRVAEFDSKEYGHVYFGRRVFPT